jgi:hypothetical protein
LTEALLTLNGIVTCTVVEGSMTKALFLEYLEHNAVSGVITFLELIQAIFCIFQSA